MKFSQLGLMPQILDALEKQGYDSATPIQESAIPVLLSGRDILGCAQTGTGKTAAFALPILQKLGMKSQSSNSSNARRRISTLVLAPTRELAIQINDSFIAYGRHLRLRTQVVFGGVSQHQQVRGLRAGVDILVATPGRLLDLMNQGFIHLNNVEYFVLDEADRMLDMGMIHDVRRIVAALPSERQTMFFSATMPPEITKLSGAILSDPHRVDITPSASTVEAIDQTIYRVDRKNKINLLIHLLRQTGDQSVLVFSRTKHGADKIVRFLSNANFSAQAIHGNKSQAARQQALNNFKRRRTRVLVATDIAARGIDVDELSHVVQFDLPEVPETYVHRIGRTGRAGHDGTALAFCSSDEFSLLRGVEKLIGKALPIDLEHPFPMIEKMAPVVAQSSSHVHPARQRQNNHRRRTPERRDYARQN